VIPLPKPVADETPGQQEEAIAHTAIGRGRVR